MQQSTQTSTQQQRIATARRAIRGPAANITVTRRATPDQRFIAASLNYRRCAKAYLKASGDWANFSATHPHEDPGHVEHHSRLVSARMALNGADEALTMAANSLGLDV